MTNRSSRRQVCVDNEEILGKDLHFCANFGDAGQLSRPNFCSCGLQIVDLGVEEL
jgi:hypothetical protein